MNTNEVPEITNFFEGRDLKRKEIEDIALAMPEATCKCTCECGCLCPQGESSSNKNNNSDNGEKSSDKLSGG